MKKVMTASSEAVQRRKLMKRCLTDEIMDILRDSDDSDGMDSSASASGSVPRVRASKSEEMTRPVASPLQRRNVIWRDHNVDDVDVDSNDSVDSLPQNRATLAELAGHGSPVKRHPKAEARPSRRESAEERRTRKQLAKKRAKLQRREMKKLEKRAKKEEKKRARVWMREVKDLKRQLRLQKKKRNKDKQQPDDDVDSSSQEVVAERLDEVSAGKVGSSGGGAKKHSHFFGKLRRKKDLTKKKNEDDVDTKNKNEDDDDEDEETAVSPRQQRRRAFKSVSLRAMRKKDSTTPDHSVPADEAAAEETTSAGGGGRLVSFWRKRPHGGSKKAKDAVQPQPQSQPGATAENDENETPTSSVSARLPMDTLLANSRQTGSSAVGITDHDGDNGDNNDNYEAVEGSGEREVDGDDDEVEEEQLIEEDEDEEDELEEWERGKGKEVEQQQQLYEGEEEEEVRVAEDKGKEKEEQKEEWCTAAVVPVATHNTRQAEGEIRYSVAVQAMGQPLFGKSLARLIENQRLEEKMLGIPTLAVPRVMYILCRALLQRSGAAGNMEGLFRVSGSSVEVQRLQDQLEIRDYDVCAFDCYAIASCMEAWLSQLPEPIIPEEFYNDCVKNANRPDQSLLIIDRIPEINKCVVWCICEFVRRITQPKQVIKTMMNAHNLAIVFAPSLLRCGDQAIMFYLSTFEVMFVQNLFQSYANLGVPLISLD
ncbi:RhoGAP domain containing protein [Acanthamoeba castellanii str. Neff]|uniref:RhoGAP domain containing protein n=1 Tax=Acanthamoeba castellanii (strain ATCC 30010 / Neff) TaxID=1257118 RepID=L8HAW6_ACACF|nr:RhoGAP domain containing protein [Acanthamoeba castellanii str. Neff]ELR22402.1 RhoGAP domain containing protein [Acanthamoeba castellanii str. Neff]